MAAEAALKPTNTEANDAWRNCPNRLPNRR
jgi:hypothetical protein